MKQGGGKGNPPALPRRRRHLPRRIRRGALWLLLAVAVAGSYGAILASRMPAGEAAPGAGTGRFFAGTRRVGAFLGEDEGPSPATTGIRAREGGVSAAA